MTSKNAFHKGWSWFKFNNLGLVLDKNLKFYTIVAKGLRLKIRKFSGLTPTFAEVTDEKLLEGVPFCQILGQLRMKPERQLFPNEYVWVLIT